ncbi:MAG: type II toxin-antitoxin system VapC family toxin [Hyphomicrobiales bacterium]|nr:type II toxin-antitoxin system VapC family toxin [Hyphomicrobiales bacterium]
MIAVDTSALMAIVLDEAKAQACAATLVAEQEIKISAATLAECLIVAQRQKRREEMRELIEGLGMDPIAVTAASARRVGDAYQKWGKGIHPAGLNFGDCFAYVLAQEYACGLLYVGNDFSKTDVRSVI